VRAGLVTMTKRVRLCASSWIAAATVCRPNSLPARRLAMPASDASRRPAGRLRRCSTPAAFDLRQVRRASRMALRQRLRVRQHRLMPSSESPAAQQVVAHEEAGLADDVSGVCKEQVERAATPPSVLFSIGTTPKSAAPPLVPCEHLVEAAAGHARSTSRSSPAPPPR
jgi:hypothetical protein